MLTKLTVRNFKRFDDVVIDLSPAVVFIGPNNSGKTSALQALALWDAGCRQWLAKRQSGGKAEAAKAVTIGRKDLVYLPLPATNALWRDLKVREGYREDGKTKTHNILIDIVVEGVGSEGAWTCGFEFEYVSEEFFYCRPVRLSGDPKPARMPVPLEAVEEVQPAFLPPLGGLLLDEPLLKSGRIEVLLGSGRSGEVLRNLCYAVLEKQDGSWERVVVTMQTLFGVVLNTPIFVSQLGTIELDYAKSGSTTRLPITSAGLGMLQTLQLLVYLHLKPRSVLLLDEPDAHLETLRQRQMYQVLVDVARLQKSQVICASHSEVVLNEAIDKDTVIAFVGKPHAVSGRQGVLRALRDIGFEHYMQAEQMGWVLYVEGSTDLAILQAWAKVMNHPAGEALARPFVHYLNTNLPSLAHQHFSAVKEANPALLGVAIYDRLDRLPQGDQQGLSESQWKRREIENYFATPEVMLAFARDKKPVDLIETSEAGLREQAMRDAILEIEAAVRVLGEELWSVERKASEQVLPQILQRYNLKVSDHRVLSKGAFCTLVDFQRPEDVDAEVREKLDLIHKVATAARRGTEQT